MFAERTEQPGAVRETLPSPHKFLQKQKFIPKYKLLTQITIIVMPLEQWQKIKTRRVFDGFVKIDKITFRMQDGKIKDFDIKTTDRDVVSVVGITPDNKIILTKQFRPGPEKIFYEFPLGFVDKGEKSIDAAKREFLEETGYTGEFKKISVEYISAYDRLTIHCFIALNCRKVSDELKLDEGEFIEVHLFPLQKLREMLKRAEIRNFGEGYLALDFLGKL